MAVRVMEVMTGMREKTTRGLASNWIPSRRDGHHEGMPGRLASAGVPGGGGRKEVGGAERQDPEDAGTILASGVRPGRGPTCTGT